MRVNADGLIEVKGSPYGTMRPVRFFTPEGRFVKELLVPFNPQTDRNQARRELEILEATKDYNTGGKYSHDYYRSKKATQASKKLLNEKSQAD